MSNLFQPPTSPSEIGIAIPAKLEASFMLALNSNASPTDVELDAFDAGILSRAAEELDCCELAISRTRETLDVLLAKRLRLQETLTTWRSVGSAVRSVPREILTEIFQLVYPRFDVFARDFGPWNLTHVCRTWRQVALDTPSLWSNFFTSPAILPRSRLRCIDRLHRVLSCGSCYPLSVVCDLARHRRQDEIQYLMLVELLEKSSRWKSVHLTLDTPLLGFLNTKATGYLPLLETLSINVTGGGTARDMSKFFELTPRLKDVALCNVEFKKFIFPLPQLERLRLEWTRRADGTNPYKPSIHRLHYYLKRCPLLQSLDVVHDFDSGDPLSAISHSFVHQSISVLHVTDATVLESITLPCLRELYIVEGDDSPAGSDRICPPGITKAIADFIERSRCPLEILTVQDVARSAVHHLVRCLDLVPSLHRLELRYNDWSSRNDDALIQILVEIGDPLLPNLTALYIVVHGEQTSFEVHFVSHGLHDFIEHRWIDYGVSDVHHGPSCTRIQTVHVSIDLPVEIRTNTADADLDIDLPTLRSYKEDGLDISICTTGVIVMPANRPFLTHPFAIDDSLPTGRKMVYI